MPSKVLILILLTTTSLLAQQDSLHLTVGDPARKNKEAKVVLDAVTETATGEQLTPGETVARLAGTHLIYIGESHTTMDFHRVQKKMIEELQGAGRKVLIGLEMYPSTEQQYLDDWCGGLLTESGFIRLSHWYKNWGYHWNYYRDIFVFARDHGIRMFALNAPREVVSSVTKKGLENLSPEERAHIAPKIDTSSEEHLTLFKAFFAESMGMHSVMSDSRVDAMFASQCTWDATMGYNAVQALKEHGDENTVMVVLIGSGHVAYNLGIQRQAAQWYDGKMASIIPIQVLDERGRPVESVQASYADYIWGLPQEKAPLYPELGVATNEVPGESRRRVLSVSEGSPARSAGFQSGDVLISMDGVPLTDAETLNRLMAGKSWGDSAVFVVRRQSKEGAPQELTLIVNFRRPSSSARPAMPGKQGQISQTNAPRSQRSLR
ncbi:MAG: ChaN family lipoprotein [Acidobacteriia bacterium]|nr:ChaN family lipoprotein [Terriglobia bacterium]